MADQSLQSLRQMLKSNDPAQRRKAVMALGDLRDPRAKAALQQIATRDPSESVRGLAAALLGIAPEMPADSAPVAAPITGGGRQTGRGATTTGPAWTCTMCGAAENTTPVCAYCGEPRPVSAAPDAFGDVPILKGMRTGNSNNRNDLFLLNPQNRSFALGLTRKLPQTPVAGCVMLFLVPFLLAGVLLGVGAAGEWLKYVHLSQSGVSGNARVTEKYTGTDDDGDTTYHIHYSFTVGQDSGERTYTGNGGVGSSEYKRLNKGSTVQIIYYSGNPAENVLASRGNDIISPLMLSIFAVVTLLVTLGVFWGMASHADKQAWLVKNGTVIEGEIVRIVTHEDSDGDLQIAVHYRFVSPSGKLIEKEESAMRNDLRRNSADLRGCPVKILYGDERRFMLL